MTKRLLAWDGEDGSVAWFWHEDGQGDWAIEMVQDTTALLDFNVETQNHYDTNWSEGDGRMVARIPPVVVELWRKLYGVDCHSSDPDMQRKVDQLLSSNEWLKLRTDNSRLA